jgi:hypothetical protein
MKVHRVGRVGGAIGVILLLGGCEVEVNKPPPRYVGEGPREPAPPPPAPPAAPGRPAPPPPPPAHAVPPPPPRLYNPPPPPPPAPLPGHLLRIVHPLPSPTLGGAQLDVAHIVLRVGRKCGPAQLGGGHWIHLDCNVHVPIANATPASLMAHKISLMQRGVLRLLAPSAGGGGGGGGPAALPDSVDHRLVGFEGPIKDQGQVGSCTSFSLSSAMDNGILRQVEAIIPTPPAPPPGRSAIHIWSHYGIPAMQNAATSTLNRLIAGESVWAENEPESCEYDMDGEPNDCGPYGPGVTQGSPDSTALGNRTTADGKGDWKITAFDAMPTDPTSIATVLATGADVWFSMDIGNSWMNPNGDTIADWNNNSIDGGHAVLFAGYRHVNGQRQFLVHNSWSTQWGNAGYAYISEAMVTGFIKTAYTISVTNPSAPPAPPPPAPPSPGPGPTPPAPSNALTDADCPSNQLVDSVTGQCANMCPDDSRPANGVCDGGTGGKQKPAPTKAEPPKIEPKRKH